MIFKDCEAQSMRLGNMLTPKWRGFFLDYPFNRRFFLDYPFNRGFFLDYPLNRCLAIKMRLTAECDNLIPEIVPAYR
jgi:hypothetical protein